MSPYMRDGVLGPGYISGGTRTDRALKYVEANSFTHAAGDRAGVANILIVMTDGKSNVPVETIFAIGIGSGVDKAELQTIATDSHHVFEVSIDGAWTTWGSYSPCTKSCGSGTQFRERSCTNPRPANGGADCTGNARENHACNTAACPTAPPPTTTVQTLPPATMATGCVEPADIVFILDASGSVGASNFQKMLGFVNTLVDGFPIGPTQTHIGLLTFDTKVYNQFHLNKYNDKTAIKNAVTSTQYTSGTTHTAEAIKYARETSFSAANGMRANVAKVAIIVTDGKSNNAAATASEAASLRAHGITVFAVGVGAGAQQSELNSMATDPDSSHWTISTTSPTSRPRCHTRLKVVTLPPTTPAPKADCQAQADIMFLLDSSGSVGSPNFQTMKGFVHDMMNSFNIGPNAVQVGVDTFQTSVKAEFYMNTYQDRTSVQQAINNIAYHSGLTHTGEALRFMHTDSFSAAHGDRANVPNIAIVVTDGQSNNPTLTAAEAKAARDAGITILAIGVGHGVERSELNEIASDPDSTHVFTADSFSALSSLNALLSTKACEGDDLNIISKPHAQPHTAPNCAAKADVAFILDSSGSIGATNYQKMLQFVRDVTSKFDVGPDKVRIATEIFSDRTFPQFNLNRCLHSPRQSEKSMSDKNIRIICTRLRKYGYTTQQQLLWDIGLNINNHIKWRWHNGVDEIGTKLCNLKTIPDAYTTIFNQNNGDRPGIPNIAIVVTDGRSTNRPNTLAEAQKLRNSGVQVFAVGVGGGVDTSELNAIASDPDSSHRSPQLARQRFLRTHARTTCQTAKRMNYPGCARATPSGRTATALQAVAFVVGVTAPPPCLDKLVDCNQYPVTSCTGQCPIYYNMPPQCTLVKKSGGCCLEPVCQFKGTHLTTNGQSTGTYNGMGACAHYDSVPSECHLETQAGKCCAEPVCTFNKQYGHFIGTGTVSGKGTDGTTDPGTK
ncbi:CO6A6-like protein, partial [Mya arenaria]